MASYDNLAMGFLDWLVASMSRRIQKLCHNKGNGLDYPTSKLGPKVISTRIGSLYYLFDKSSVLADCGRTDAF
jgi:hypothetical protein